MVKVRHKFDHRAAYRKSDKSSKKKLAQALGAGPINLEHFKPMLFIAASKTAKEFELVKETVKQMRTMGMDFNSRSAGQGESSLLSHAQVNYLGPMISNFVAL